MAEAGLTAEETIDYLEFIMAIMHMNRMDREDHLHTTFQYFDKDSSGYITEEELEPAVKKSWNLASIKGAIQYQRTFCQMLKLLF
jgi:calcium-dependent protein kinase